MKEIQPATIDQKIKQSSRGIALMDEMESFKTNNLYPQLTYRMKLRALVNNYPERRFYDGLAKQLAEKNRLSLKQVNAIDLAFNAMIRTKRSR